MLCISTPITNKPLVELLVSLIIIPSLSCFYIRNIRTQPNISVKTGQRQIFRKRKSANKKAVDIHWHLELINNSSFDSHLLTLMDITEGKDEKRVTNLIPLESKVSIPANNKVVVKMTLSKLLNADEVDRSNSIEILSLALGEMGLTFKFYCEYENKYGAKFYSLITTNNEGINSEFFKSRSSMLRNAAPLYPIVVSSIEIQN